MYLLKRYDVWLFIGCVAFFLLWADIDLHVSHFFYDGKQGFILKEHAVIVWVYNAINYIGRTIIVLLSIATGLAFLSKSNRIQPHKKTLLYLLLCAVIGPVVIVDGVLKKNLDRPRPHQVIAFGGPYPFEPPFSPRFVCNGCESFVSGHAAVGFYFLSIALWWRCKRWIIYAIVLGSLAGAIRIVQGGHFLSDVVFSGWVVWFSSLLIYYFFKRATDDPDTVLPNSDKAT